MQLGETIATYDVALALRGESGKFVVTSPAGEIYQVVCKQNHSIVNLQWSGNGSTSQPFLIRKVAEPVPSSVAEKTGAGANEAPGQPGAAKTPFLIGTSDSDTGSGTREALDSTPAGSILDPKMEEVEDLYLVYEEAGAASDQATAWVCLAGGLQRDRGTLVTNACTTFNAFDAEIRRLHAQLDDIRCRARKKFYQAQVVAARA